jgi:hypothetical protein
MYFCREEWLRCIQEVSNNIHAKEQSLPEEKHVAEGRKMVKTDLLCFIWLPFYSMLDLFPV